MNQGDQSSWAPGAYISGLTHEETGNQTDQHVKRGACQVSNCYGEKRSMEREGSVGVKECWGVGRHQTHLGRVGWEEAWGYLGESISGRASSQHKGPKLGDHAES